MPSVLLESEEVSLLGESGYLYGVNISKVFEVPLAPEHRDAYLNALLKSSQRLGRKFFLKWSGDSCLSFTIDKRAFHRNGEKLVGVDDDLIGFLDIIIEDTKEHAGLATISPSRYP
ncbi:MAG: hypothetical protein A3I39_01975 [Candidatus Yanofskybacteria bacterium RIFCSPLOWO2_02_FULL_47_9b]|uniref:Uncharacterized protein n=1 Tax=Candidatus Yanofskybacteria bacterium RIFCSPLOWO2_02_FULL_47_9b TaxID=1802708 RepID=A0A1F8HBB5_9BACT|nr:MAG: hypothetical protein A3I39_01975 [Candidatus Yanofskybacteria bacterium RIFCSPLOWO2_02_FULL_47_9b]